MSARGSIVLIVLCVATIVGIFWALFKVRPRIPL
jgi:hypothetical protein